MKHLAVFLATAGFACAADFVTGQAARLVIGQESFSRQIPGASQTLVGATGGVAFANDILIVADSNRIQALPQNNRVLVFRDISSQLPKPGESIDYSYNHPEDRCPVCGGAADVVLGQPDFLKTDLGLSRTAMRTPTAVATDGAIVAVADTDNNRVLIWNSIPTTNNQPADVVVGQADFDSGGINYGGSGNTPSDKGLRGPQGVWIHNGRLYVADTQNHRVLIWNSIPTQNGQPANLVLGKPNFTTFVEPDLTQVEVEATASTLLNPVSVTTDGTRLYVADLGHNRVLVWNAMPSQNGAPADFAIGQPDVESRIDRNTVAANNSRLLCDPTGQDQNGNNVYPPRCAATLNFPRFALSDGQRLFIADGGNDRILVYNRIPIRSGQPADIVIGQFNDQLAQDSGDRLGAVDAIRTPSALAWDGVNLYASDPFNRRVMVFTLGNQPLLGTAVRNAASREVFAIGAVTFTADPKENDEVTLTVGNDELGKKEYKYKAAAEQTIDHVINGLVEQVNGGAGDPLVFANPNLLFAQILLTARVAGAQGNAIPFSIAFSSGAQLAGGTSGATLSGGGDAARIAPGSLVTIFGENLAQEPVAAPPDTDNLPLSLGGVEVYFDGMPAPLLYVSPTQINAQMPWEVNDATSVSAYVRKTGPSGEPQTTTAVGVPIVPQNPGIFAQVGPTDPRPAIVLHGSSHAVGIISVDGSPKANDIATVTVEDRPYTYTVKTDDNLQVIRDALIEQINQDPKVSASAASVFNRIVLEAREEGEGGEGIAYTASANQGAGVILTAFTQALCCANRRGEPVTEDNPAVPGETIIVYATGLGIVQPDEAKFSVVTGGEYTGPVLNRPNAFVDAIAGGKTANVLFAGLKQDAVGLYEVVLQLNSDIPTNPQTQLTIAQDVYVSNIVTFPVVNPNPPE
jgi:hypothetical protein